MASFTEEIQGFKVSLFGGPDGKDGAEALIALTVRNANVFFRFYDDLKVVPKNTDMTTGNGKKVFYVNFKHGQFDSMLNVLRTTSLVKFVFDGESKSGGLVCDEEKAGSFVTGPGGLQQAV